MMADFRRNEYGTPMVADLVLRKKDGSPKTALYSRPSGFTKQIESTYNLQKWSERGIATGIALALQHPLSRDQVVRIIKQIAKATEQNDALADSLISTAKEHAKSSLAADRGTWVHALTEMIDGGLPITDAHVAEGVALGIDVETQQRIADAWRTLLADHGLEVLCAEQPVVNDEFRTAGRPDRIVRLHQRLTFIIDEQSIELPETTVAVLDLKTGEAKQMQWWNNYSAQVYLYASSVPYDTERDERQAWGFDISRRWGLLAHVDVKAALAGADQFARLLLVDLDRGREACLITQQAKTWSQRDDVFGALHSVAVPVAASPSVIVEQPPVGPDQAAGRPGGHLTPQQQVAAVPTLTDDDTTDTLDWSGLQARYAALPDDGVALLKRLMDESMQAGVSWHRKARTSDRRWHLYDAALLLAEQQYDDQGLSLDILRALIAQVVDADWPLYPSITAGRIFGSLTQVEAQHLAQSIRELADGGFVATLDRDVLELRRAA